MADNSGLQTPDIVNPVLTFGYVQLKFMAEDEVSSSLQRIFDAWEIRGAKTVLWDYFERVGGYGAKVIGERRNRIDSCNRTADLADCNDLVKALKALRAKDAAPQFAITMDDLEDLPPVKPVYLYHPRISQQDSELSALQEELRQTKEHMDCTVASLLNAHKKLSEEMELFRLQHTVERPERRAQRDSARPHAHVAHVAPDSHRDLQATATVAASYADSLKRPTRTEIPVAPDARDNFTVVTRRRRRHQKVVKGTAEASDDTGFRGAPEVRSVFIGNVHKTANEDEVAKFLRQHKVDVIKIRTLSHPESALKSFKVTVIKDKAHVLLSSDFPWPLDIRVRRFMPVHRT